MTHHDPALETPIDELDTLAQRVDRAVDAARQLDEGPRAVALELKDALEAIHKAGLTSMVRKLKDDPRGKALLFEMVDEPLIYALLVMHGIVRPDLGTRVARVIAMVQPYMRSHGGDVELVDVRDSTVYVRLHGACNGCSMSAITLREGLEEALKTHVPEITALEVVPNEPGPALIRPDAINVENQRAAWIKGPPVAAVAPGTMQRLDHGETSVLIVNLANRLSAYRNACAHRGLPLDGAMLDADAGTLTCPWHGFCFDASSGECLTAPQSQLEPFPLRVEDGYIWVRPG